MDEMGPPVDRRSNRRLGELARLFLKLGATGFGGPAAHIALMEDEVVRRRGWLDGQRFLDLVGASNLIPGPTSTELAIHIGHLRAGWPGLVVAGLCFIAPAMLIVGVIAWAYVGFGALPEVAGILYGIKPVMIAVVLQALWSLGRTAVRTVALGLIAAAAFAAALVGMHELLVLAVAGALAAAVPKSRRDIPPTSQGEARRDDTPLPAKRGEGRGGGSSSAAPSLLPLPLLLAPPAAAATAFSFSSLFLVFAKIGAVLFGSGYVLLAFLRADLVERLGWLTEAQLLDAVAVGQVTPGPVFTTATFIGYVLGGPAAALVATAGIFLPAFFFVAVSGPLIPRLRRSPLASAILDGVNVASLALMAAVTIHLGRAALIDLPTVGLAAVAAALLLRYRVNTAWLMLGGALLGAAWWYAIA